VRRVVSIVLIILALLVVLVLVSNISTSGGGKTKLMDEPIPSSCQDLINQYLEKNRSYFDELATDGPGTSGFIDCGYDYGTPSN